MKFKISTVILIVISSFSIAHSVDSFKSLPDLLLPLPISNSLEKGDQCVHLHNEYSTHAGSYYRCAIEYSEPEFHFCCLCATEYNALSVLYNNLTTAIDANTGKPCVQTLFNNNPINMFYELSQKIDKMWTDASCGSCYNSTDFNSTNVVPSLSDETMTFNNLTRNFNQCLLDNHKKDNNSICGACEKNYTILNAFYEEMKKSFGTQLCFDIVGSMNKTRIKWSGELNCCRDKRSPLLMFYISAGLIASLTVVFYFTAFIYSRKDDDDSQVLLTNNDQPGPANVRSINSVPGTPTLSTILNRRNNNLHSPARNINPNPDSTNDSYGHRHISTTNVPHVNLNNGSSSSTNQPTSAQPKKKQNNIEVAKQRKLSDLMEKPEPPATGNLLNISSGSLDGDDELSKKLPPVDLNVPESSDDSLLR